VSKRSQLPVETLAARARSAIDQRMFTGDASEHRIVAWRFELVTLFVSYLKSRFVESGRPDSWPCSPTHV